MRLPHLSVLAVLSLCLTLSAAARTPDKVSGSYYFYDPKLDNREDDPMNVSGFGGAKLLECQGKSEVRELGQKSHYLTFTPEKAGDFISFQIHVAKVDMPETHAYSVKTVEGSFHNEGIYQFFVNDQPIGPEHDGMLTDGWPHGKFSIVPGDYKITYRYVGPSPKGGGTILNLMRLEIS